MSSEPTSSEGSPLLFIETKTLTMRQFTQKLAAQPNQRVRKIMLDLYIATIKNEAERIDRDEMAHEEDETDGDPEEFVKDHIVDVLEGQGRIEEMIRHTLGEEMMSDPTEQIERFKGLIDVGEAVQHFVVDQHSLVKDRKYYIQWNGLRPLPDELVFAATDEEGHIHLNGNWIEATTLFMLEACASFLGKCMRQPACSIISQANPGGTFHRIGSWHEDEDDDSCLIEEDLCYNSDGEDHVGYNHEPLKDGYRHVTHGFS